MDSPLYLGLGKGKQIRNEGHSRVIRGVRSVSAGATSAFHRSRIGLPIGYINGRFLGTGALFGNDYTSTLILVGLGRLPLQVYLGPLNGVISLRVGTTSLLFLLYTSTTMHHGARFKQLLYGFPPFLQ